VPRTADAGRGAAGIAVVAFGGNALLPADMRGTVREQRERAGLAARPLVDMLEEGWRLLLVHGNGPQVGHILIQQEEGESLVPPMDLALCVAATQGTLGYLIEEALRSEMARRGVEEEMATILTMVLVDADDPAFLKPAKQIGPHLTRQRALYLRMVQGTSMAPTQKGYRRTVASPRPLALIPAGVASALLEKIRIVTAGGGGGVPVVRGKDGGLRGVEAVVDKDRTAALLAREAEATALVFLTEVSHVFLDYGRETERPLGQVTADQMRLYLDEGQFPEGSMGPKIEAALDFLAAGGDKVVVTDLAGLEEALDGERGTHILP